MTDPQTISSNSSKNWWQTVPYWVWLALGFILISICLIVAQIIYFYAVANTYEYPTKLSDFGEMFGGLETSFSGLALAGIIIAIILQNTELSLQRQELIETRKALEDQANSLKEAAKIQSTTSEIMAKTLAAQELLTEINLITTTPVFETKIRYINSEYLIEVINPTNYPAIDVEILVCLESQNSNQHKVFDYRYSFFPSRRGVERSLPFPNPTNYNSIYLFIQYKSGLGRNYTQLIEYSRRPIEEGRLRITSVRPDRLKSSGRIRFSTASKSSLPIYMDSAAPPPEHLDKLANVLSTLSGPVIESLNDIKDFGQWFDYPRRQDFSH